MGDRLTGNQALRAAFELGYICKNGEMFSSKNKKIGQVQKSSGYPEFSIRLENEVYNIKCHRLVAYQKYGEQIFNFDVVVRHLNNDRLDYSYENIEMGNQSENILDIPVEKRRQSAENARRCAKMGRIKI